MRSSADWVKRSDGWVRAETAKTRGLNRCFNRTLKSVGALSTVAALHVTDNPLLPPTDFDGVRAFDSDLTGNAPGP